MAINKKLIHFNKKEDFQKELDSGNILNTSIIFIKDSKEIWTHGEYYSDLSKFMTKEEIELYVEELFIEGPDTNGYEFVDLGLPSGLLWATCNIGANSPEEYGLYFSWGETKGYETVTDKSATDGFLWDTYKFGGSATHDSQSKYNSTDGLTTLEPEDDAVKTNIGGTWRMPTSSDFQELINNTDPGDGADTNSWISDYNGTGISGMLRKSKTNGNSIFFPAAGLAAGTSMNGVKYVGLYWSSSLYDLNSCGAYYLGFNSSNVNPPSNNSRFCGLSVRGVLSNTKSPKYLTKTEINETFANKDDIVWLKGEGENAVKANETCTASGNYSIAKGLGCIAEGLNSSAEGLGCKSYGHSDHAEGYQTQAGNETYTKQPGSHAEGFMTKATGATSHAEGSSTTASGNFSHAEGTQTISSGVSSHSEGGATNAIGDCSHAEGNRSRAQGTSSHAEGIDTEALNEAEHASGKYNKSNDDTLFSVGNGKSGLSRHNAFEITTEGDIKIPDINAEGETHEKPMFSVQSKFKELEENKFIPGKGLELTEDKVLNCTLDTTVFKVVESLPDAPTSEDENKIHLVPAEKTEDNNKFIEYVYINDSWEKFGEVTSDIDLSNYNVWSRDSKGGAILGEDAGLEAMSRSVAIGLNTYAGAQCSLALGELVETRNIGELAIGEANYSLKGSTDSEKTLFTIGAGSPNEEDRFNCFEIRRNGDIYLNNGNIRRLVKLQDIIASIPKEWFGTQDEYDALGTYDENTKYYILEETSSTTLENRELTKIEVPNFPQIEDAIIDEEVKEEEI